MKLGLRAQIKAAQERANGKVLSTNTGGGENKEQGGGAHTAETREVAQPVAAKKKTRTGYAKKTTASPNRKGTKGKSCKSCGK